MTLAIGDQAPDFTLMSDDNATVSLKDFKGKKVILFFYPKDHTPGCTQEACDFRDYMGRFTDLSTVILGISKDSPTKHAKFKQDYQLPFTLLSDDNADVCTAYGVIDKSTLLGKTFLGIKRTTFLIDEQGKILHIWHKVKVQGHIAKVLELFR